MVCFLDFASYVLAACYAMLDINSVHQIFLHWNTFTASRAQSLQLYLYCTVAFATLRALDFAFTPWMLPCGQRQYEWRQLGESNSVLVLILATLPAGLFFTSYSSFAYSIARVYDSLTLSSSHRMLRWSLFVMNFAVYLTLLFFWGHYWAYGDSYPYDRLAQFTLATSALATASGFLAYGVLTLRFYNSLDADYRNSVRAEQVERLFRMSRIVVVSVICTACFAFRAVLLIFSVKLQNGTALIYFFLAEVVPTFAVLYAFRARGSSPLPLISSRSAEYELLKNQMEDALDHSAVGTTSNPYAASSAVPSYHQAGLGAGGSSGHHAGGADNPDTSRNYLEL